jgi:peptidoglycan-associated lipoprotein
MVAGIHTKTLRLALVVVALLVGISVSGCHTRKPVKVVPKPVAARDINNGQATRLDNDANTHTVTTRAYTPEEQIVAAKGPVVYFAYDSSEVSAEYNELLDSTAKRLLANKTSKLRLEGNTDERGSAEYNIGLGERRAQAVKHALTARGVAESQLSTVSYGAERPQAEGHDESAWTKNRRVDLIDAVH